MARKPIAEKSVAENCLKWGVGGINIDECRVGQAGGVLKVGIIPNSQSKNCGFGCNGEIVELGMGRFPANVITDGSDEVASGMPYTKGTDNIRHNSNKETQLKRLEVGSEIHGGFGNCDTTGFNDEGSAMRYFYCAKASKKDRDDGLDILNSIYYELDPNTPKEIIEKIKNVLQETEVK